MSPTESPDTTESLASPPPRGGGDQAAATPGGGARALSPAQEILGSEVRFNLAEQAIATATGIHVRVIAKVRTKHLTQGEDWEFVAQKVAFAEKSLPALLVALGIPAPPEQISAVLDKCRPAPSAPIVQARVTRFYANRFMLQVRLPDGSTTDLRVKRRDNFTPQMTVPIRLDGKKYVLARREPRNRGRW